MIIDRPNDNQPNVQLVAGYETVQNFNYLGSMISGQGSCTDEIKRRLAMVKVQTVKLTKIWKNRSISKNTKLRLVNAFILISNYPMEIYGNMEISNSHICRWNIDYQAGR